MPLSRYEIRNEYSLADPELYRAADKDDPEALLEGVAMAGLVGVLRQLGDLAEFAAEIFHDLHEDLMATAARGHSLTVRVQQIEAEFPSIEKAFLSQTSHSLFFYNTGVDWHPNVHLDQNLLTQGDLPRFVMDSYEECRGPPRLFLLDKFDVAGAGSCLKRYTDPSFFKAESPLSVMPHAEVQREKKGRKSKKKGSRWKNSETPEVLSTSHVKLQQLLLEERVENHISDPARRVKLKRRLNGSPFNSAMGKSYMDAILKIPTPDLDVVREISIASSPPKKPASVATETENEVLEITAINPDKSTRQGNRSMCSSSDSENGHKPSIHPLTEEYSDISPNFSSTPMDDVLSTPHEVDKKEIVGEGVRKIDGYQSDDEVENYVDALTSMDSEMETDSEYRAKNGIHFLKVNGRGMGSDATEELSDIQTNSADNQSIGNCSLMDGVNSSSRKGKSYSGSFDLAENTPSEGDASAKTILSAEHREAELVNSLSDGNSFNRNTPSTHASRHIIQGNACRDNGNGNISSDKSESGEPSSSSSFTESGTVLLPADPGVHFMEVSSLGPELDKISSNHSNSRDEYVNDEENSIHLVKNIPWKSKYNDQPSQTEDAGFSKLSLNSMNELNDQDTHEYHASLYLQSVSQLASDNDSDTDIKKEIMQGEFLEKEHVLTSVASAVQSISTLSSQKEELAKKDVETFSLRVITEENAFGETDCLATADLAEMQLQNSESNHSVDPGVHFSHSREIKHDGPSSRKADGEEMGGMSSDNDLVQKNDDESNFVSEVRSFPDSQHTVGVSLDDGIKDTIHLQAKNVVTAVAETNLDNNGGDAASLDTRSMKLQGKCSLVHQELHQNGLKFDDHIHESSLEEMVNEQADVSSTRLPCDDYSDLDLLHRPSGSSSGESSRNSSHVDQENAVISSYQNPEDAEAKALQKMNVIEKEEDAPSSPTCDLADTNTTQGPQVELYNGQIDSESWHEQILESKSAHHAVVMEDTEQGLSSPKNQLAGTSDQKVGSHDGNLDVTSCHGTHDQGSELKYFHQNDAMEKEGDISSPNHHVAELRTSPEENFELHKDQFDLESSYDQVSQPISARHIDFIENVEDSISSPTHHQAKLGATLEQMDEIPRDNLSDVKSWHDQSFEPEHVQQIEATESSEIAPSSDTHFTTELTTPSDQTRELEEHFDENSRQTNNANMVPLSLMREGESLTPHNQERETYPSDEVSDMHLPRQPSLFVPRVSVPKPAEDPLSSKISDFGCLPKASSEEIPPLPPLPPMQWTFGKETNAFPAPEESLLGHSLHSVPPLISTNGAKSSSSHPATEAGNSHPSNPFSKNSSLEYNNSQDMNVNQADNVVPSGGPLSRSVPELVELASKMQVTPQDLVLPMHHSVKCEDVLLDSRNGTFREDVKLFSPPTTVEDTPSALPFCSSSEKAVEPPNLPALSTSSTLDDKIREEPIVSEENSENLPTTDVSVPVIHVYDKQPVLSTSGEQATWTSSSSLSLASSKDGMENGNEKIKLPRPRNPLIDAVVAHDKSKLRKVTQLPQPQIGKKAEERDSLLEQIRAKSFNLKPAVVTRPSIQGPKTNLRLAAILEKANAIRQAFAGNGSDEDDDEDEWSDS